MSPLAKKITAAVRIQMDRQSWALEAGQVSAALFSNYVDLDTKSRMAGKILALRPTTMRPSVPNETSMEDDNLPNIPSNVVPVIMTRKKIQQ